MMRFFIHEYRKNRMPLATLFLFMFASVLAGVSGVADAAGAAEANGDAAGHDAASLRAQYAALAPQLRNNQFQRPLTLQSTESSGRLRGDIYAVLDHPFSSVNSAFNGPAHWCDMLILHLNTKYCRATNTGSHDQLQVAIGKKTDEPLSSAYRVNFNFAVAAATPDYLDVVLNARDGPMGTSDYRIMLEAAALPDGHTFLHLTYSYAYGMAARLATQAYLSTVGSGKVGFTKTGNDYIGGVRGVVERNTMRYYLAIDSYLAAGAATGAQQLDRRLESWFTATERYPRQLHEVERVEYFDMKRSEYKRQQTAQ